MFSTYHPYLDIHTARTPIAVLCAECTNSSYGQKQVYEMSECMGIRKCNKSKVARAISRDLYEVVRFVNTRDFWGHSYESDSVADMATACSKSIAWLSKLNECS